MITSKSYAFVEHKGDEDWYGEDHHEEGGAQEDTAEAWKEGGRG